MFSRSILYSYIISNNKLAQKIFFLYSWFKFPGKCVGTLRGNYSTLAVPYTLIIQNMIYLEVKNGTVLLIHPKIKINFVRHKSHTCFVPNVLHSYRSTAIKHPVRD